jgi:hypothetical protein
VTAVLLPALSVLADIPAAPVLAVMTFALVITLGGHINKNYTVVGVGLAILFLATFAMILGAYLTYSDGGERDPRPCGIPAAC